jgi:uncharacterized protein (DUF2236 family)
VHATLLETYVSGRAYFCGPLRREEIERFYGEYRGLGRLIGVRAHDLPPTWTEFREYFDAVARAVLVRTEAVATVFDAVHNAAAPPVQVPDQLWRAVRIPARRALWLGGVGLLTPALRRRLEVSWSLLDEAQFRVLGRFARGISPLMPQALRVMGPDHLRWRRHAIAHGPLGAAA